jgi:hypothetical protein
VNGWQGCRLPETAVASVLGLGQVLLSALPLVTKVGWR